MLIPKKRVCDICKEEIGFYDGLRTINRRFAVCIDTEIYGKMMLRPKKQRVDICPSCWSKMTEWVVEERYKEE